MNLLADTHVVLWWLADDVRLGLAARAAIADPGTRVAVSAATAWEVAIKTALGKLQVDVPFAPAIAAEGFDDLAITSAHAAAAGALPRHHDDPFDRMLIAQARAERLVLCTADPWFRNYEVDLLPAGS